MLEVGEKRLLNSVYLFENCFFFLIAFGTVEHVLSDGKSKLGKRCQVGFTKLLRFLMARADLVTFVKLASQTA